MGKQCKFFKITSSKTDKVYVGHTNTNLEKLLATYRNHQSYHLNGKQTNKTSNEILQYGDAQIILLENFEYGTAEELLSRKKYYFAKFNCVNKRHTKKCKRKVEPEQRINIRTIIKYSKSNRTVEVNFVF